jgi:hypothetical protein
LSYISKYVSSLVFSPEKLEKNNIFINCSNVKLSDIWLSKIKFNIISVSVRSFLDFDFEYCSNSIRSLIGDTSQFEDFMMGISTHFADLFDILIICLCSKLSNKSSLQFLGNISIESDLIFSDK